MRKLFILLFILLPVLAFANIWTVVEVSGQVEQETSINVWKSIQVEDRLTNASVIRTGIGARLVLRSGNQTITIRPMQVGLLLDIIAEQERNPRVSIGGNVTVTDTSIPQRTTRGAVSTASARASDAASELEFEE